MVQRYNSGGTEDVCQRVTYSYDTNPVEPTFSQYSTGRLTAVQYTGEYSYYGVSCGPGPGMPVTSYAEEYSYHPAGAVTTKRLRLGRDDIDPDNNQDYGILYANLDATYSYDSAGRVAGTTYQGGAVAMPGPTTFTYSYDSMGRPAGMTDNAAGYTSTGANIIWAQNVQYDFAGRMTGWQHYNGTYPDPYWNYVDLSIKEARGYNTNGQMSSLTWSANTAASPGSWSTPLGLQYVYSTTQNNGQITQAVDSLSGETTTYQYDSLKRLTSAAATSTSTTPWTQTFQYDGFGNLSQKVLTVGTGSPVTTSIAVNAATNRLSSASYDANGNMTAGAGATMAYDDANRISSASVTSGGTEYYGYSPDNKRMYRLAADGVTEQWTFYGARGEKLGVFSLSPYPVATWQGYYYTYSMSFNTVRSSVWFAGNLIWENGAVTSDRLGTNRAGGARFYPYGEEITSTGNDRTKFATCNRDSYTGFDYADQRFYASSLGRFNTADPVRNSAVLEQPGSWNRYGYVYGDPANRLDPSGLTSCDANGDNCYDSVDVTDDGGEDDDSDVALPQINKGPSPVQQVIPWLAQVRKELIKATTQALKALDKPECAKLFGFDSLDAEAILSSLIRNSTMIGPIKSPSGTTISATTQGTTLVTANGTFNGAEITINDVAGAFITGTPNDRIVTLLHEFGHAVNFIYGDGTSQIVNDGTALGQAGIQASMNNTALVKQNCLPVK